MKHLMQDLRIKRVVVAYKKKNAGWWPSRHGVNGDTPADILAEAINKVITSYQESWQRSPTYGEFADALSFVTRGQFTINPIVEADISFDREHMDEVGTNDNQGQIDSSQVKPGELVNRIPPGKKDISDQMAIQLFEKDRLSS